MLDLAAQLARNEPRTCVSLAAAHALDRSASPGPERHATLHRGRAQLREERLIGLARVGIIVHGERDGAAALEVTKDAAVHDGGELDDVLVGQRGSLVEDRSRERTGAGVEPVEGEHVEVQVEMERATEALRDDDRARATVGHTGAPARSQSPSSKARTRMRLTAEHSLASKASR